MTVYGDFSVQERAPIVSLNIGDNPSEDVCDELAVRYGIATRGGAHCAPLMHEQLGTVEQGLCGLVSVTLQRKKKWKKAILAVKEIAEAWT